MGLKFKIIMTITILRIYGKRMAREVDMGEIGEIEKWIRCSVREREREREHKRREILVIGRKLGKLVQFPYLKSLF